MALARRTRSTRLLVITLVFASLLTITVDYRGGQSGPLELTGKAALTIIGPMQQAVAKVTHPVGSFFTGVVHIASLESENRQLKQDLQRARIQVALSSTATTENNQLRKLLGIRQGLGLKGVTASVIAQSLSNFEWSVTIDAGSSQGVKMDLPVVGGLGLVGHVTQVAPDWSRVTLIIDPESSVAGRLVETGDTGLVVGNRDQDMAMQMVNPHAKVVPGEQVVTAGYQGALYPPGILIGVVSHVAPAEGSLVKNVSIAPLVDFSSLQFVMVVTGTRPVRTAASPSPGASASPSSSPPASPGSGQGG
jgi:rod shape-determining protein MreC